MACQHGADAIVKGIARRQHAHLGAAVALRQHVVDAALERARPGARLAADKRGRQPEMAFAPEPPVGALPGIGGPPSPSGLSPPNPMWPPSPRARAAGLRPSTPSSPMPTIDSQRR